jgi:2-keto-3-deoxy-L-rhamnonate aldolase RhmA
MSDTRPPYTEFRKRLTDRELVVGTFIKTPTGHATEILGDLGFDFVVIDEEHAPFDRGSTDATLVAARVANTAGIVRVPNPSALLSVLDCGATGVLVPHVDSEAKAREVVAACRYRNGHRGFSNSPRAGGYGRLKYWEHVDQSDAQVTVIAMIEDPPALDVIDAIVAVEGLDAVFIGRGDLTVSLGVDGPGTPEVKAATETITAAALKAGKAVLAMSPGGDDAKWLKGLGVSGMIVASDQGFMRQAAGRALSEFRELDS